MRNIDKLTEKHKKGNKTPKTRKNIKDYRMTLKSRIILDITTGIAMIAAPLVYVAVVAVCAVSAFWDSFIDMPLEVRDFILDEYVRQGIAKKKLDVTEI